MDHEQRISPARHALKPIVADPDFEIGLAAHLRSTLGPEGLADLYGRHTTGPGVFDSLMRRVIWRGLAKSFGNSVVIAPGAQFRHLESIEIGDGVFIGEAALLQGHALGQCRIGNRAWIGPQCFVDARALTLADNAALGPGVRILTAGHTGLPADIAVSATDQLTGPVSIGAGADIGTGAVILPGCSIGAGAIVGAGAVVTGDLPPGSISAGVPARVLRQRGAPTK